MKLHFDKVKGTILDIKPDKRTEVYNWGADNAQPTLIDTLFGISSTAKSCADKVSKAIYGKSFGEIGSVIVNKQGQSLNEVLRIAAREYAKQNNSFIHLGITAGGYYDSIKIVPSKFSRYGKADDLNYSGKIVIYNNWDKTLFNRIYSDKFKKVDVFNTDTDVINSQRENAGGREKYLGQIIHLKKDTTFKYAVSDLDTVKHDALLEYNSALFRSSGAAKGFLNTKLLAVQPFDDEESAKEFRKELNGARGAENASEVVLLQTKIASEDMAKNLYLGDLSSDYKDELLKYSDERSEKSICKAMGVPRILVSQDDSGLFGNSGEMLKQARIMLWEDKEEERDQIEEVFRMIMVNWVKGSESYKNLKIINPFETIDTKTNNDGKN